MIETMSHRRRFRRSAPTGILSTPSIPPTKTSLPGIRLSGRRGRFSVVANDWIGEMTASDVEADHSSLQADERFAGPIGGAGQSKGGARYG
jgi:hypothetical protein